MPVVVNRFETTDRNLSLAGTETLNIQFGEPVAGLTIEDFRTVNLNISDLKTSDGGKTWTLTIAPDFTSGSTRGLIELKADSYTGIVTQQTGTAVSQFYTLVSDTKAPDSTTTRITIDPITDDNVINKAESQDSVQITGKVTGEFRTNDTVMVKVNEQTLQTTVKADGTFAVTVAAAQLVADGDQVITASVAASDAAGNINRDGSINTSKIYSVDTIAEGAFIFDNFVDSANPLLEGTGSDFVTNDNTFTLAIDGLESGSEVSYQQLVNGTWEATTAEQTQIADGDYDFKAIITDGTGNVSEQQLDVVIDTQAGDAPTDVELSKDVITGLAVAGSVVVLQDEMGNTIESTIANQNGQFEFTIPAGVNTDAVVVASIDIAGNMSQTVEPRLLDNPMQVYTAASSWNAGTGPAGYEALVTTAANDLITIGDADQECWTIGTRGNIWNNNPAAGWAVIDTGAGDDSITTGVGGGTGSMFAYTKVAMGTGDDTLTLTGDMVNNAVVDMGTGDDAAFINGFMGTYTHAYMGTGEDTLTVNDTMLFGSVADLGAGNDVMVFNGKTIDGHIKGGCGIDELVLNFADNASLTTGIGAWKHVTNLATDDFSGIEQVTLAGNNVLDVRYADLFCDDSREGALFITGNSTSKVDLGATDWNSDTDKNLRDASGGVWEQTGSSEVDGVMYDVYQHCASYDMNDAVYIEQGVMVI